MNLFIDTHLDDVVVILADNEGTIAKQKILKNTKENSRIIMPTVKEILDGEIPESIIVVNGPGSFTGVRLGVTIAKTLAYTLKIPIRTITSLECMALSIKEQNKIVAFSDKNGYYIAIFNDNLELIGNYEYLSKSEFNEYIQRYTVITDVTVDYSEVIKWALNKEAINPHKVNPIYVKKLSVEK